MIRLRSLVLAVLCLLVPASTVRSAPVPAARSGLEQVPATAPIVIHLRGINDTHDRLETLLKKALPDVHEKFKGQINDFFENGPVNLFKGRKLDALKKDGPLFLVYTELPKVNDPGLLKIAFVLAVTKYDDFRDQILTEEERKTKTDEGNGIESANLKNDRFYFVNRKGYAVLTPDKEIAESFTKKITGLNTKLSKEQSAKLLASDYGAYVDMEAVNKQYSEQIKEAKQGFGQGLDFAAAASGEEWAKQIAELFKSGLPSIFQTIEDMQTLIATVEFRAGGLALHLQSDMMESSTTANLLQGSRPDAFKELERLPQERNFYLGTKPSSTLFKTLSGLISGLPGGESKDLSDLMKELDKAGPEKMFLGASLPISGLIAYHYTDPAKAVAAQLKLVKAVIDRDSDPQHSGLKKKPNLKPDAQKHGDFKLHSVQLEWDLDKMADWVAAKRGDDAKKQFMETLKSILGEKTKIWFGTDGKTAVQIVASDWESASKLLDEYSKGGSVSAGVKALRREMPVRTSFLGMIDVVQFLKTSVELARPYLPASATPPPDWPNMAAKGAPTHIGLALTLQPKRGGFDLFVPIDAFKEFYSVVIKPLLGE